MKGTNCDLITIANKQYTIGYLHDFYRSVALLSFTVLFLLFVYIGRELDDFILIVVAIYHTFPHVKFTVLTVSVQKFKLTLKKKQRIIALIKM